MHAELKEQCQPTVTSLSTFWGFSYNTKCDLKKQQTVLKGIISNSANTFLSPRGGLWISKHFRRTPKDIMFSSEVFRGSRGEGLTRCY